MSKEKLGSTTNIDIQQSLHGAMYRALCKKANKHFRYRANLQKNLCGKIRKNLYGKKGHTLIIESQFIYS